MMGRKRGAVALRVRDVWQKGKEWKRRQLLLPLPPVGCVEVLVAWLLSSSWYF
jgi:hypothetical protein